MNKDLVLYFVSSAVALAVGVFVFWGPNTAPRKRRVPVTGLKNLGFTCFLNALLQALASCPYFIEWLEFTEDSDTISHSLADVLKVLSTEPEINSEPLSPIDIIISLQRKGWSLSPGEQDAHELFHHLILTVEEEVQKCKGKVFGCLSDALIPVGPMPPNITSSTTSLPSVSVSKKLKKVMASASCEPILSSSSTLKSNGEICRNIDSSNGDGDVSPSTSVIVKNPKPSPFTGFLTSQTHCTSCGFKSVLRYDKFDSLSLHLPPLLESKLGYSRHTLVQLLERFVKTEMVSDFACERCNKSVENQPDRLTVKTSALKNLTIGKLPRCLCIHIPRTLIHANGEPYKRQDYVDFPEFLSMDPYTQNSLIRENQLKKQFEPLSAEVVSVGEGEDLKNENGLRRLLQPTNSSGLTEDRYNLRKTNNIYRIKAVVVHKGALEGGHFVTYRRGPLKSHLRHRLKQNSHQYSHGDRRWYLTSDAEVRDATLSEALQAPAYMLFYEKCVDISCNNV